MPLEHVEDLDGHRVYTVAGLAKAKNVSVYTLYDLLKDGELVGFRQGLKGNGAWAIREDDWEAFQQRRVTLLTDRRNAAVQAAAERAERAAS